MRKFMGPYRLWGRPGGPDEDWIKPHVLWLPQCEPEVIEYFRRLRREVIERYPDVIAAIADKDLHLTVQSVTQHNREGMRVGGEQLARAAVAVQRELDDLEPLDIEIGPARASGSAGIVEIWPERGMTELNRRVRTGLLAEGLVLPPEEKHYWPHISCGYGVEDATTAEAAARSDQFASDIGKKIRPAIRTHATVSSVWLVWERQVPQRNTYTFTRVRELYLGSRQLHRPRTEEQACRADLSTHSQSLPSPLRRAEVERWTVAEGSVTPKKPESDGEDRLVLVQGDAGVLTAAVVDGATSKSKRTFGDLTGGARAADRVADVVRGLSDSTEPTVALKAVTEGLGALRSEWSVAPDDVMAPSAVAAVFLPRRRLIWRVGDVHVALRREEGWEYHPADKAIDRVVAGARTALLRCRLARGTSMEDLAADDVGRTMVLPILSEQNILANCDDDEPLGFGVLDGRPVPNRYLETFKLDDDVVEVVIASDGYLSAAPTLQEAERQLATSLAEDPLRIGAHSSTKAAPPEATSFDDRTYVRLIRE